MILFLQNQFLFIRNTVNRLNDRSTGILKRSLIRIKQEHIILLHPQFDRFLVQPFSGGILCVISLSILTFFAGKGVIRHIRSGFPRPVTVECIHRIIITGGTLAIEHTVFFIIDDLLYLTRSPLLRPVPVLICISKQKRPHGRLHDLIFHIALGRYLHSGQRRIGVKRCIIGI